MGDKNNSNTQKTETPKLNPAKNVHSPSLPVKSQKSLNPSKFEKRGKK